MSQIGEYVNDIECPFSFDLWPRNTKKCTNQKCNIKKPFFMSFSPMQHEFHINVIDNYVITQWQLNFHPKKEFPWLKLQLPIKNRHTN